MHSERRHLFNVSGGTYPILIDLNSLINKLRITANEKIIKPKNEHTWKFKEIISFDMFSPWNTAPTTISNKPNTDKPEQVVVTLFAIIVLLIDVQKN